MRVLVTGHRGYIGSVLVTVLRHARFEVVGLDCDLYQGRDFGRVRETIPSYCLDLREVEFTDLLSFDAVIHLAALQESTPPGIDSGLICEVNEEATIRLAECSKKACVSRFLFASSCGVYGRNGIKPFEETSPADPITQEGASKLRCERALDRLADHSFSPVFLRQADVYGVSPRLRTDLMVNGFVASAVATGCVVVPGDWQVWRPVVHVEDLARAYAAVLIAPDETIHDEAFNVAAPDDNHRAIDIADAITELVPQCTRRVTRTCFDEPSYRVSGSKMKRKFPKLSFRWNLPTGIRQLRNAMFGAGLTPADLRSDRYGRVFPLSALVDAGTPTHLEIKTSQRRHIETVPY